MPGNYAESFYDLPPASGHLTPQQIELSSVNETAVNDAQKAVLAQIKDESSISGQLRAAGTYVSDLGTKAVEGVQGMVSRFGENIPFLSAGAKTPTFSSLVGAATGAVTGIIGSAFGGAKGLIPDSVINNLVALKNPLASAKALKTVAGTANPTEDRSHLVTLTSTIDKKVVEFLVMPEVVENRTVGYEAVAPPQFPGAFQKYKGTEPTQWTVNATFISRTSAEASLNLKNMNILRGWTMPFFGENTRLAYPDRMGAPPPVLMLKGLRKSIIGPMPVVITSLSWNWPKDVDYIPATLSDGSATNIPFPTVIQVAIQCVESLSTQQFNQFNLDDFFRGKMIDAYLTAINNSNYGNEGRGHIEVQPEAQYVSGTGPGQGAYDPRRLDQAYIDPRIAGAAQAGRGLTPASAYFPPKVISQASSAEASAADAAARIAGSQQPQSPLEASQD
jgi:hypothetical protein